VRGWVVALLLAVIAHVAILLFGGVLFMGSEDEPAAVIEEVDLLTAEADEPEAEEPQPEEPPPEELVVAEEPPPIPVEIAETPPPAVAEPADLVQRLDALSLSALEGALAPGAGGDSFGPAASLASGGRIGGTAAPGSLAAGAADAADAIFDITMLDQQPRLVHQVPPAYPLDLRKRRIEGTVYVVFVVDREGRVQQPEVESAPHEAFTSPVLEAVRRWRFEPAVVRGDKVRAKLRVPIRFSAES
jgi:protein TonB